MTSRHCWRWRDDNQSSSHDLTLNQPCLFMGNLDSLRDWGHARDYVDMQWRMLQQQGPPEDFVIATGRQESERRFIELLASELG